MFSYGYYIVGKVVTGITVSYLTKKVKKAYNYMKRKEPKKKKKKEIDGLYKMSQYLSNEEINLLKSDIDTIYIT